MPALAAEPRVPRRPQLVATNLGRAPAEPLSTKLRRDLDELDDARLLAVKRLADLEAARPAIIRDKSDEEAEAHDAEIARQSRAIERADLRRPAVEQALAAAEREEEAGRRKVQQEQAEQAVQAVLAKMGAYNQAAEQIASFLLDWNKANTAARLAGISTLDQRLRFRPEVPQADTVKRYSVWIDPNGIEHSSPAQPAQLRFSERTGKMEPVDANFAAGWREEQRTRTVKHSPIPARALPDLAATVLLPGLEIGEPSFWPPRAEG